MTPEQIRVLKAGLRACSYRGNQPERALEAINKLEVDCQTYSRTMDEISKMPLTPADAQRVIAAKDAEIARLRDIVRRYRNETPLGHQPHMIAHEADTLLETSNG